MKYRNYISEYDVYTIEEAKEHGIKPIKDWRKAEKGDWILTGDNKVLQCLQRYKHALSKSDKKPAIYIFTCYGGTSVNKPQIYANERNKYIKDANRLGRPKADIKPTELQRSFLQTLINNGQFVMYKGFIDFTVDSKIHAYMSNYRDNNPDSALRRANYILSKKFSRRLIGKLMKHSLDTIGIDDDYIAGKLKEFIEQGNFNALKEAIELRGHHLKSTESVEQTKVIVMDGTEKKLMGILKKRLSAEQLAQIQKDISDTKLLE